MKRTRRVSVEIEHREISISLTLIEPRADSDAHMLPDSGPVAVACPICGAPWVFVTPKEGASQDSPVEPVASVFRQLGLHPPIFAGGMFLICRQSFDQLREKL
jgi:hypothetical protein